MPGPPQEIVTACAYWVLKHAERPLTRIEVARRVARMSAIEIQEARRLHAEAANEEVV